ncbi:rho GTPase-activating protein 27-like isoform X5 [Bolinopsis microptera]|uniref:rho GTPase-activating protein 27-like isoform X5 n=1 Tax=Bolinopsis microptera TaxID=2820187 RepID=UPI00307A3EC8
MVIVRAIFDYNGSSDHKIQFVKGDTFELVDDRDPNWWHVTLPRRQEQELPEHIYVPATYVEKYEDENIPDLPPPPSDAELASISSENLLKNEPMPKKEDPKSDWMSHEDGNGKTYYFNVKTQISQWKKPDELQTPPIRRRVSEPGQRGEVRREEQHYASLLPKGTSSKELRKTVNAGAANSSYSNISHDNTSPYYANLGKGREEYRGENKRPEKPLKLHQTAGQTTCNENTRRDRKHSSPSASPVNTGPMSPTFTPSPVNGSTPKEMFMRQGQREPSPRPYSVAVTSESTPLTPTRRVKRQLSDHQLSAAASTERPAHSARVRTGKKNSFKSRQLSGGEVHDTVVTTSWELGNSAFHDNTVTISAPHPTTIPKLGCDCLSVCTCGLASKEFISSPIPISQGTQLQVRVFEEIIYENCENAQFTLQQILDGYIEDKIGDDIFYICKNTNEKWKLVRNPGEDKIHYFNPLTGERVWTLPVYQAVNRTFSNPTKPKHGKALDKRSKSLSDYGRSPVIKCEGTLKRKITKTPPEVKSVEKSWASFYAILKSNTIYFYKDVKHFKRNEFESACDITNDALVDLEPDKKGIKLIKISKPNGLEMLLRVKAETGVKASTFESWLENLSGCTGTPYTGLKNSLSTSDISHHVGSNGHDTDVDRRSILDCKEITKKDITEFLNKKMKDPTNKSSVQKLLEDQGIDISHLDKSKKKEVLNRLLTSRPSFSDLERKGLIKYTVFGCPLAKLCTRQKVAVPRVLTDCVEAIEYRGLKSGGMYRISGNSASIQKLRFKFDREETVNLKDEEFDINMLTGFLKLFLRELPEPVIPFCQYPIVEQAINGDRNGSYEETLTSLKQVVHDLPEPNKSTFKYIILHLVRVAHEEENQMDEHNLSIIFGPSLLGNHPDRANLLVDLPIQNTAVEKIITNYRTIFK